MTISYRKALVPAEYWLLEEHDGGVVLTLGLSRLRELRDAMIDMKRGGGDYAIGGDEGCLWIWWHCEQPVNKA